MKNLFISGSVKHTFGCRYLPNVALLGLLLCGFASGLHAQTWNLVWSDEFNGAAGSYPSSSVWNFDVGNNNGWGNGEIEYYCAPGSNAAPCSTSNPNIYEDGSGHLVIRASKDVNGQWTSGRMHTEGKQQFTFGRIEASMQLPEGAGLWPAFWMLGANIGSVGWPSCGEQDIMEWVQSYGNSTTSSHIHGPGYSGASGIGANNTFGGGSTTASWHTYGNIWSNNQIQFYRDNYQTPFLTITPANIPSGDSWVFNNPFFILLNLAVGGGGFPGTTNSGTPNPELMLVDYVRVYQLSGGGGGISTSAWYNIVNQNSGSCVDDTGHGTTDGTAVQQWACGNQQTNQEWQFQTTSGGYYKIASRYAPSLIWDVTNVSMSPGAKIQLWTYGGGLNQQWQPVSLGNGYYKMVNRNSGLCLDVPGASTANGVQLQQYTCNGTGAQAWKLNQEP